MKRSPIAPAAALSFFFLAAPALGQERELSLSHQGSLSAFAAMGPEYTALVIKDCVFCGGGRTVTGFNSVLDLGGTLAVGDAGNELELRGRLAFLSPARGESLIFGKDDFKTFANFDLMATFRPVQTAGARAAFGATWDFSPVMGLWLESGATFGIGFGRRFGAELLVGFQGRTYLLE